MRPAYARVGVNHGLRGWARINSFAVGRYLEACFGWVALVRGAHASRVPAWASRPSHPKRSRRDAESSTRDACAPRTPDIGFCNAGACSGDSYWEKMAHCLHQEPVVCGLRSGPTSSQRVAPKNCAVRNTNMATLAHSRIFPPRILVPSRCQRYTSGDFVRSSCLKSAGSARFGNSSSVRPVASQLSRRA